MSDAPSTDGELTALRAENARLATERDEYRKLYLEALELCRKLEQGIIGQKREKLSADDKQLTLSHAEHAGWPGHGRSSIGRGARGGDREGAGA